MSNLELKLQSRVGISHSLVAIQEKHKFTENEWRRPFKREVSIDILAMEETSSWYLECHYAINRLMLSFARIVRFFSEFDI